MTSTINAGVDAIEVKATVAEGQIVPDARFAGSKIAPSNSDPFRRVIYPRSGLNSWGSNWRRTRVKRA